MGYLRGLASETVAMGPRKEIYNSRLFALSSSFVSQETAEVFPPTPAFYTSKSPRNNQNVALHHVFTTGDRVYNDGQSCMSGATFYTTW